MDHNGFYAELDSLTGIGTSTSSFSDANCSALPSLNNYKYPQSASCVGTNSTGNNTNINNIYQQQTIPDLNHHHQHSHSHSHSHHSIKSTSTSALPQTQININNCNNNIFFPHDDGLGFVDATQQAAAAASCASTNLSQQQQQQQQQHQQTPLNNTSGTASNASKSNNFIGYVRKEAGPSIGGGGSSSSSGGGDSNITYNINNINTNIVNNINNPTSLVGGTDIFGGGGNQYHHQISKNGETIINFTNGNLNASMPADNTAATSQNFYGYQATNLNSNSNIVNSAQGQQQQQQQHTLFESSVHAQSTQQLIEMGATKSMGSNTAPPTNGIAGASVYHHTNGGAYGAGAAAAVASNTSSDFYTDYSESLSAAKIINTFESKNPLKYSTMTSNRTSANAYYKNEFPPPPPQYHQSPVNHIPPHGANYMFPPSNGMPPKISPNYEMYGPPRIAPSTRSTVPPQHFSPYGAPSAMDFSRNAYHHMPHHPPPSHHNNYGNYYGNGATNYSHPMPQYSAYPPPQMAPPYATGGTMRSDNCSKTAANYSKSGAMALSPVDHGSFSLPPSYGGVPPPPTKKDFYTNDSHYFSPSYHPDPATLNSCAKNANHAMNGNVMRNAGYQPLVPQPKHYNVGGGGYSLSDGMSSCDYQSYNYRYKNGDMSVKLQPPPSKNPLMSGKQFKTFNHFEPMHPPAHIAPHHYGHHPPQYHTMQVQKHPDKIKISIDLEEQINSSKIPKSAYGYDLHYAQHPSYYAYHRAPRNPLLGQSESDKITNINISLRDFLSTWNELDDEEESRPQQASGTMIEELSSIEHMERAIMREYNPMFVQKATENIMGEVAEKIGAHAEMESGEGTEKLYVLETIDVPISELNKYKHLSVINKLPENVVISDKERELFTDMEMNREKLYKSEFELEFEACQQSPKVGGKEEEEEKNEIPTVEIKSESDEEAERRRESEVKHELEVKQEIKEDPKPPLQKVKKEAAAGAKSKQSILKLKKEKIIKTSKDPRKTRIAAKRIRKYSLNQKTGEAVKSLQSLCVDFLNTSTYRNYAREQLSISKRESKLKVLKDFKKRFNFDSMKKPTSSLVNQKTNHSVRVNSLREMCGKLLVDKSKLLELDGSEENELYESSCVEVPTLKELCMQQLTDMNVSVVESFTPSSLVDICESFIYNNRQYFHIEEVSSVPKLQDMCKGVLADASLFNILTLNGGNVQGESETSAEGEPIYIVEESSGNVGDLFESDTLNAHEKSELLRKIQQNIDEDDDEIIRAIGALHDDDDNNNSNVFNKNIALQEAYTTSDELVQYEEIISEDNQVCDGKSRKVVIDILRHKYLNRSEVRQATKTIGRIVKKSLGYMRVQKFRDAKRKERINLLVRQARCALLKLRQLNCESHNVELPSPAPSTTSSSSSSSSSSSDGSSSSSSSSNSSSSSSGEESTEDAKIAEEESQINAKVDCGDNGDDDHDGNRESPQSPPIATAGSENNYQPNGQAEATNFPVKMPIAFPSINEYRLEQRAYGRDVKDGGGGGGSNSRVPPPSNKRKMSFDESLLHINKIYRQRKSDNKGGEERRYRSDWHYNSRGYEDRHHTERSRQRSRRSRSRSRSRSKSRHRTRNGTPSSTSSSRRNNNNNNNNYHTNSSSRHDHYRKPDQSTSSSKHSEARRLVLPRYKIYDKDLDVKLKVRPIVRIEREERVDDLVKKYN